MLLTERLLLRPFRTDDYDQVHDYASDPDVTRYTSFGPNTTDETREFLERSVKAAQAEPRLDYSFAVTQREDHRLIGGAGLYLHTAEPRIAELGYVLRRDSWGQGYATETARALVDFGFKNLLLHRIYARYHPLNLSSAHVMEKVGMKYEGILRESAYLKGSWWDFGQYAILRQEWK